MKMTIRDPGLFGVTCAAFRNQERFKLSGAGITSEFVAEELCYEPEYQFSERNCYKLSLVQVSEAELDKPKDWDGEGIPPVGVPVEYQRRRAPNGKWYPTQINFLSCQHVIFCDSDGDEIRENPSDILFRPTRTPEQIAAEEREAAIKEMVYGACGCTPGDGTTTASILCGLIYDAGYRK